MGEAVGETLRVAEGEGVRLELQALRQAPSQHAGVAPLASRALAQSAAVAQAHAAFEQAPPQPKGRHRVSQQPAGERQQPAALGH